MANTSVLKSFSALSPSSNLGDGILFLYFVLTVLRAIARNLVIFSGNGSKNGQKPAKLSARKIWAHFFPDFPVNGSKPWPIFSGFCQKPGFLETNKKALSD